MSCFVVLSPLLAPAQSQDPNAPLCAYFWTADAVFIGTVTAIADAEDVNRLAVTFRVVELLNRHADAIFTATTERPHEKCGWAFEENRTYIVYVDPRSGDRPTVGLCRGTRPIQQAQYEVNHARYMQRVVLERANVSGWVTQLARPDDTRSLRRWPVPHATVVFRGTETVRIAANGWGKFEVGLLPGEYSVDVASAPGGHVVRSTPETVWIPDARACATVEVTLRPVGSSGRQISRSSRSPTVGAVRSQ
jgi:hypothetical protein